eukprot:TRINITY_DN4513_c2_g1_i1.p1 TRINITY_DN4513_c2_g1~~TRINITY_DN4513_c2_g1_i1.p1  ORF type:complete len:436 (+),score=117.98 TRINITY_DN4513_c2_g1_i1:95-1402(+)
MAWEEDSTTSYRIKDIKFFGSARRILMQSANGPCPLLAICNVLLLRNQLKLSSDSRYVSFSELVEMVSNYLFDVNSSNMEGDSTSSRAANVRENLNACLDVLPRLHDGLDVNCRFQGPSDFEYTSELSCFDLLDIGLYHGWIVSSQDEKAYKAFAHQTYNQIVERLIAFEEAQQRIIAASAAGSSAAAPESAAAAAAAEAASAADGGAEAGATDAANAAQAQCSEEEQRIIDEGLLIKDFMDRTATQLSYEGLLALHETLNERQLAVFFRNSHFSTMLKYGGELYLLCTDIAFVRTHVVWEKLDEVDGDTSYVDADFKLNTAGSDEAAALAAAQADEEATLAAALAGGGPNQSQSDMDALLAMQLMQEDLRAQAVSEAAAAQRVPKAAAPKPAAQPGGKPPVVPASAAAAPGQSMTAQAKAKVKPKKSGKSCVLQ